MTPARVSQQVAAKWGPATCRRRTACQAVRSHKPRARRLAVDPPEVGSQVHCSPQMQTVKQLGNCVFAKFKPGFRTIPPPKMGDLKNNAARKNAIHQAQKLEATQICTAHFGSLVEEHLDALDDCIFDVCRGGGDAVAELAAEILK